MMKILLPVLVLSLRALVCESFTPNSRQLAPNVGRKSIQRRHRDDTLTTTSSTSLHGSLLDILPGIAAVGVIGFAGWLYIDGSDDRRRSNMRQEENARYEAYQAERAAKAYIEPKDYWTEEELAQYNGTQDEDGPILFAADGLVFNVYKGRNFYGPGGEYHIFAGRDATRLLARTRVEEESEEESKIPLTVAERAALAGWMFTFKNKYDIVGKLEGFDKSTTSF